MTIKPITSIAALACLLAAGVSAAQVPAQGGGQPAATSARAAPVGPAVSAGDNATYVLGPDDKVRISVFGVESLTGEYSVTAAGNISMPLIGNVPATGRTIEDVGDDIRKRLSQGYVNDPRIAIELQTYRMFYILGEVNKPGAYPVTSRLTLAQAVATAGGYTYRARKSKIAIRQMNEEKDRTVSAKETGSIVIKPGDTITVPERFF